MTYERVLLSAAIALGATGCFKLPTTGELGRADFTYDEGVLGCLFGCDLDAPMAAHANTFVNVVNDEELPLFVASSSDTGVLEFVQSEPGDASIRVISHEAGSAFLVLEQPSGALIDRVEIDVADVARIELESPVIESRYLIFVGGSGGLSIDLLDRHGRHLKGFGGVEYTATDGLSATGLSIESALAAAILRAFVGSTRESASVVASEVGAGSIEVTAPSGASLRIPVEVVDASAVARLTVDSGTAETGEGLTLAARAYASDDEYIVDPECEWTVTNTSGAVTVAYQGRNSIRLEATGVSTADVTCTIGGTSATGTATFTYPRD